MVQMVQTGYFLVCAQGPEGPSSWLYRREGDVGENLAQVLRAVAEQWVQEEGNQRKTVFSIEAILEAGVEALQRRVLDDVSVWAADPRLHETYAPDRESYVANGPLFFRIEPSQDRSPYLAHPMNYEITPK
ncbi:hypothetical protein COY95_00110 [Candidatus Woesearchaeota archaeon CG_4_10_14_0_8_um_filter_47_5]|nr:MAG: hypothetical protein COY95_00110 [Candidatus Woesearchaeota archaeon CG_4_10_14_0_8_um_filter_47_5]